VEELPLSVPAIIKPMEQPPKPQRWSQESQQRPRPRTSYWCHPRREQCNADDADSKHSPTEITTGWWKRKWEFVIMPAPHANATV